MGKVCGFNGGFSRITIGSGVNGRYPFWRIIIGGAGVLSVSDSCFIIKSPCGGGVGGFKCLT